ncbi:MULTISPECIES: peptide chain release factor N(5)-glutamine methyltransferase [Chryseobacterium]|uniref:peptide chain release factor N(5)-glutamine methyltransferase n=1 Tax=Chryseobacterium TaxID=59732 RepID=UPI001959908E|nr:MULTISPECIES: peptide chain release factor N(5)-glutamine methyltransferase [Chryseobacterium]MBM7419640.1 release factor glutamine methyltransferase [Chryseobacterium sp. JUb44]MDH6209571.1 release factor glutamine methyltransferase [Chryseobacterium sp. BIGb0186]WSO08333.1 peptide chain release factor N(5)-glutamine methyltransferase [Chryseobacterium scophthalmum]
MTLSQLKKHFSDSLSEVYTDSETVFIFQIFAEHILGLNNFQQRQSANLELSDENTNRFQEIISELKTGKPYLQVLGETEFYGMKIFVDENVLIPRPETEELLEITIQKISNLKSQISNLQVLDIGTGSGIIPLVLKKHFPEAEVSSIDFSEKALEVAKKNADFHKLDINFIHADYLSLDLNQNFDVIISNPPYIGIDEENEIADSVKGFEPTMALFSPTSDALIFYRKIAEDSKRHLNKNGLLFLEINQKLGSETLELYKDFSQAELIKDLSENDRFIFGIK